MVEFSGNWSRLESAQPYGFCDPYISATMRVVILKQKSNNAHFSDLQHIKFSNKTTKPSEHEYYFWILFDKENFCKFLVESPLTKNKLMKNRENKIFQALLVAPNDKDNEIYEYNI